MQNGFVESLNGRFRDECLNEPMFRNLPSARRLIEEWRTGYGAHRPHRSLGGITPLEFATRSRTDHSENRVQLWTGANWGQRQLGTSSVAQNLRSIRCGPASPPQPR